MDMNFGINRLPWYGQLGAFVGLALVSTGVFGYVYASPTEESLTARRSELQMLRGEIDRGLATARRLPEFRAELADLEVQLDGRRRELPEERDVADLLRSVQATATQSNLTILGFTPQSVTTRELHAEWPIGLQLAGTYHDLGVFLDRISKFPRIINVNNITIVANAGATAASTITVQCVATTFVLLEQMEAPALPAEAVAGGQG